MEKIICAFSSNYRNLYLADIYKVLAMPKDFIIHFRYKRQYVSDEIFSSPEKFLNKEVGIFFTDIDKKLDTATNYSIRISKLIKFEYSAATELCHIYLSLGDFVNINISKTNDKENLPTSKYLIELDCDRKEVPSWFEKINQIKTFFPWLSFYHIKSLKSWKGKTISLKTRKDKKSTYYKLTHGTKYILDLSLANPDKHPTKINFISSSDDVSANITNPIVLTAQFDDLTVPLYLKSLNVNNESSYIAFVPEVSEKSDLEEISEFQANLEIEKGLGFKRAIGFGVLSVFALSSFWVIKDHSDSFDQFSLSLEIDWHLVFAILILFVSTSYLFSKFNKK